MAKVSKLFFPKLISNAGACIKIFCQLFSSERLHDQSWVQSTEGVAASEWRVANVRNFGIKDTTKCPFPECSTPRHVWNDQKSWHSNSLEFLRNRVTSMFTFNVTAWECSSIPAQTSQKGKYRYEITQNSLSCWKYCNRSLVYKRQK